MKLCDTGKLSEIETVIKARADANAKDKSSWTVLMTAVKVGKYDIFPALINAGAGVNAKDKNGRRVIDYA